MFNKEEYMNCNTLKELCDMVMRDYDIIKSSDDDNVTLHILDKIVYLVCKEKGWDK